MELFSRWSHVSKVMDTEPGHLPQAEQPIRIEVYSEPYVNYVLWYLIFAFVFYGGGVLLGGFQWILGEYADFSQKSNRRIFLFIVLAGFFPMIAANLYRRFRGKSYQFEISPQGQVQLNGKALPVDGLELAEAEDLHGNDLFVLLLHSPKFKEPLLLYQSKDLNYVQGLRDCLSLSEKTV